MKKLSLFVALLLASSFSIGDVWGSKMEDELDRLMGILCGPDSPEKEEVLSIYGGKVTQEMEQDLEAKMNKICLGKGSETDTSTSFALQEKEAAGKRRLEEEERNYHLALQMQYGNGGFQEKRIHLKVDPFEGYQALMHLGQFQGKTLTSGARVNIGGVQDSVLYRNSLAKIAMETIPKAILLHPYHPAFANAEYFPFNLVHKNSHFNVQITIAAVEEPKALLFRPHYVLGAGNPNKSITGKIYHDGEILPIDVNANFNTHTGGLNSEWIASPPGVGLVPKFQHGVLQDGFGYTLMHAIMDGHNYYIIHLAHFGSFQGIIQRGVSSTSEINFASQLSFGHVFCFLEHELTKGVKGGDEFFKNLHQAFAKN